MPTAPTLTTPSNVKAARGARFERAPGLKNKGEDETAGEFERAVLAEAEALGLALGEPRPLM